MCKEWGFDDLLQVPSTKGQSFTAPAPYRLASNMTSWWTEYTSNAHATSVCRYCLTFKQAEIFPSYHVIWTSFSQLQKQSYTLQRTDQNCVLPLLSQRTSGMYTVGQRAAARKPGAIFPTCLGEIVSRMVRPDLRLSEGRCWTHLWQQLWLTLPVSEGWVITRQAQGAQTRSLQAFHKGAGHSNSKKKNSIISNTCTALREHVFFRGNMLEAITTSRGQWIQMPAAILEEVLLRHLIPLKCLHTPGTKSPIT